jgi:hypothetical protein
MAAIGAIRDIRRQLGGKYFGVMNKCPSLGVINASHWWANDFLLDITKR